MKIVLGSTSVHKIGALRTACAQLCMPVEVQGVKAPSGVSEQPLGFEETLTGARNRALNARAVFPEADVYVGIESGLLRALGTSIDFAVVIVLTSSGFTTTTSMGLQFPEDCVVEALRTEDTTAGKIIAARLGGDHTDPHATLTNDLIKRHDTLVDVLKAALSLN